MISNSLDWDLCRIDLKEKIQKFPFNPDLKKLLKNIDVMVDELSRLEVEARRTKHMIRCTEQAAKINDAIATLEKWIIMAAFLR